MSPPLLCTTPRYSPHILAGSLSRRQSGRRSPGKPHPYGDYPWYSTWVVEQGPFRVRMDDGKWKVLEGPSALVLPPFSGDRLDLPVSTLFSWVEWGALSLRRISRIGGGPASKYLPGKKQPDPESIWGVKIPVVLPSPLYELTRTMLFRTNTLWWRGMGYSLQADAILAQWLAQLVVHVQEASPDSQSQFEGLEQEVVVLQEALSHGAGVKEWASILEVHPRTLYRRCQSALQCSPHDVMNQVRLERAESLLLRPDATVLHVAKECGFSTRESFSQWFTTQTGEPPVRWRRKFGLGQG